MGLFSKLFGKQKQEAAGFSCTVEAEGDASSIFADWSGNIYDNDITRSAIWTNAKNAGKLNPKHIRRSGEKYDVFPSPKIKRILTRPNQYMSMSVFLNKMVTAVFKKNNAFALIRFGFDGFPEGVYPITYNRVEAIEASGFYFIKFWLKDSKTLTVPYEELIHLRMHYDEKDLFGEGNQKALATVMEVINTTDKGVINAIKKSAIIRWLLKFNSVLNPIDKQKQIDDFVKNYLSVENSGGAAATDPRFDATQVKPESYIPNAAQMDRAKERIYSYFGVSEDIIQSTFNEEAWNAYYENTIEPLAIQLSEEFTEKIFSQKEREFGNEIIFEANRLQYASNTTKIAVATFLTNIGGATIDQILDIFNMSPIGGEAGNRRVQTLNMVNADKADQYQLGEKEKKEEQEEKPDGEHTDTNPQG